MKSKKKKLVDEVLIAARRLRAADGDQPRDLAEVDDDPLKPYIIDAGLEVEAMRIDAGGKKRTLSAFSEWLSHRDAAAKKIRLQVVPSADGAAAALPPPEAVGGDVGDADAAAAEDADEAAAAAAAVAASVPAPVVAAADAGGGRLTRTRKGRC
jgi:hypothetical protein